MSENQVYFLILPRKVWGFQEFMCQRHSNPAKEASVRPVFHVEIDLDLPEFF